MARIMRRPVQRTVALLLSAGAAIAGCGTSPQVAATIHERGMSLYGESERWLQPDAFEQRVPLPAPDKGADLDRYLRFGVLNNSGLRAAFDRWRAAMQRLPQARALPDAQMSFTFFVEQIQTKTGPQRARLMLSQKVPWFGELRLRGEVSAQQAEALWWKVQGKRLAVIREIKRAYHEYAYLAQAIRITAESLQLLQQLEPVIQRKIQAGAKQAGLLRLQVEIGKLDNELRSLRQFRPALSARLSAVINRAGQDPLPWPQESRARPAPLEKDRLAQLLAGRNPKLKALREMIQREEKRTELARLEGLPDFSVGLSYFETGSAGMPVSGSGDDPLAVTFGFSLPLGRAKYRAKVSEAKAAHRAARAELMDRVNQLNAELAAKLFNLADAARQISLYQDTLIPRARQALAVTQTAYVAGKATVLDLIDSERSLLGFERAYWRANSSYEQSLADVEALCGGPIP